MLPITLIICEDSRKEVIDISPNDTVLIVKEQIAHNIHNVAPARYQQLSYGGDVLPDDELFVSCGIVAEEEVMISVNDKFRYFKELKNLNYEGHGDEMITAAQSGNIDIVKLHLNCGTDVDHTDTRENNDRVTALHEAAANNDIPLLELLLDRKATVDFSSLSGWSPLMWAARNQRFEACNQLLSVGADPNHVSPKNGDTPLIWAAWNGGKNEIYELLLNNGGDETLQNKVGTDARGHLRLAAIGGHY